MDFSDLLMFLGKLLLGALILFVVLTVILPLLGINVSAAIWSVLLAAVLWILWVVRKLKGGG